MTVSDLARMGGKARAAKLTKEQLSQQGRDAVQERWRRYREGKVQEAELAKKKGKAKSSGKKRRQT